MKKLVAVVLTLVIMLSIVPVNAQSSIQVVVNGESVVFPDALPFINEDKRTLVPLRAIGEAMGLDVDWFALDNKAVFSQIYTWENSPYYRDIDGDGEYDTYLGKESLTFTNGAKIALHDMAWYDKETSPAQGFPVDGGISEITMDTAAIKKDSRTYAPVKYLADAFRYDVGWDGTTRTATLNYMNSIYELGIQKELVACWRDYQGWMFTAEDNESIQSVEILSVTIDQVNSQFRPLTQQEQNDIREVGGEFGKYLGGFVVNFQMKDNARHNYLVKFQAILSDGTKKLGFVNHVLYSEGGKGGYI